MRNPVKVNKAEDIKRAKDGFDVLQDLLRYSDEDNFAAMNTDETRKSDLEVRFRWFGVYQQKPNQGHFMLRVKVPGGQTTPDQLRVLSEISRQYGRGIADITTRQDIQYHWLTLADLHPIFQKLWEAGMTTQFACGDCPRNIVSCPLSGVQKNEIIDTTQLARQISDFYNTCGREFSNLPRKFKPSIGGCPDYCWLPQIQDYALYGVKRRDDSVGFGLLIGGGLSDTPHFAQPMRVFVKPEQVMDVARGIATLFRDHGYREKRNRARLKFLVADKGWEWTRGTLESILGYQLERDDSLGHPPVRAHDHVGMGAQKDGNYYLGIPIERGRWTAEQMRLVADLAERFAVCPKRIRLTLRQNALILDVPKHNLDVLSRELEQAGLPPAAHPLRTTLISCTGSEFCNLAVVETKHRAGRVLRWLEDNTPTMDQPVSISFTGCPNACAQYQIHDIGLTGIPVVLPQQKTPEGKPLKVDGYNVLLGGGLGSDPKFGEVIARKIPGELIHLSLKNLIDRYLSERADEEETFRSWVGRNEPERLQKLIVEPTQAPDATPLVA